MEAGLVEFGARVRFRHPLVRSAAYRSASVADRQAGARGAGRGHRPGRPIRTAGPGTGPRPRPGRTRRSRRSWSARRAGRRPAAGWPRPRRSWSARCVLTADPARRAERTLAAAQASLQAGAFGKALELLAIGGGPGRWMSCRAPGRTCCAGRSRSPRAWAATLRRCCSRRPSGSSRSTSAWPARPTWPRGWRPLFAGRLAGAGDLLEVSRAARAAPAAADPPRPVDLVLDGLAAAGHRRAGRRGTDAAARRQRLRRRRHHHGGGTPVGLVRAGGRQRAVGRRRLARDARPAGPARPRGRRARAAAASCWARWARPLAWSGDFAAAAALDRGGRRGLRGDRVPRRARSPR